MPTLISEAVSAPICGWMGSATVLLKPFTNLVQTKGLAVKTVAGEPLEQCDYLVCFDLDSGRLLKSELLSKLEEYCRSRRGKAIYCSVPEMLPASDLESALAREGALLTQAKEENWDLRLVRYRDLIPPGAHGLQTGILAETIELLRHAKVPTLPNPISIRPYSPQSAADCLVHLLFSRGERQALVEVKGAHSVKYGELLDDLATELHREGIEVSRPEKNFSNPIPLLETQIPTSDSLKRGEVISLLKPFVPNLPKTPIRPSPPPIPQKPAPPTPKPVVVRPPNLPTTSPLIKPIAVPTPLPSKPIEAVMPRTVESRQPARQVIHARAHRSLSVKLKFALGTSLALAVISFILAFPLINLALNSFSLKNTPQSVAEMAAAYNRTESLRRAAVQSLRQLDPVLGKIPGVLPKMSQWVEVVTVESEWRLLKRMFETNLAAVASEMAKDNGDPSSVLKTARADLERLYQFSIENSKAPGVATDEVYRRRLPTLRQFLDLVPTLFKFQGQTNFLLLLQNNLELRPTGGFLGEVGEVKFDRGRVFATALKNVYQLDSELRGHVDPPPEITTLLGEENWYLRDANWDPHFPRTAVNTAWFAEKEIGTEFPNVVGVNLITLQSLLQNLGQITLNDGSTVTAANLLNRAFSYKELGAGESLKADFSSQVLTAIFRQFRAADTSVQANVIFALVDTANAGQLTIYAKDPQTSTALEELGWTGALLDPACPASLKSLGCYIDTFYVNEANVGINKTNYYLSRTHHHQINLSAAGVRHSHQLTLINTAQSETWPAGKYKAYVRWYLPKDAKITALYEDRTAITATQYAVKSEQGRRVVSLLVEIAPAKQLQLRLDYEIPRPVTDRVNYTFLMQKQPGTGADPLTISVVAPEYHLTPLTDNLNATQAVQFQGDLKENFFGAFELSK